MIFIRRTREQFRLGELRSFVRIFYPLLARKSSDFAPKKLQCHALSPEIWKILGVAAPAPASDACEHDTKVIINARTLKTLKC